MHFTITFSCLASLGPKEIWGPDKEEIIFFTINHSFSTYLMSTY